jgi:hypothetical protein
MERAAYHHGTFVDPTKDLFTIVDLSHVWVLGEVYEIDLPFVRTGQAAEIELPYSGGGKKIRGRVDFIYPFLDPKSRTVQVRMEFPNSDLSLKPEMFTNIGMSVGLGRQIVIPQDALMDTGAEQYVFIDKGNGYVEPRKVKVATEADEKVGTQNGLKAGERVVTGGNFIVDSESLSSAKTTLAVKRPPSPGCIRDASRQAQVSSRCGDRQAVRVCDRCPERWPGRVPEIQGLMRSEVCLGCSARPTRGPSSSDDVH